MESVSGILGAELSGIENFVFFLQKSQFLAYFEQNYWF